MKLSGFIRLMLAVVFLTLFLSPSAVMALSLIHISEPTRPAPLSRMPSSA